MNRIKQLREERGITQPALGKVLNVQGAAISKYESERIPLTSDTIKTLAEFFGVSTDYLLGKTDNYDEQEQSEPAYTTQQERDFLSLYRQYLENGFSDEIVGRLADFFPEMSHCTLPESRLEYKLLDTFRNLDEDNQDIIIGKSKELLRQQHLPVPPVATEAPLKKAAGK